jgi:hypothetical protein
MARTLSILRTRDDREIPVAGTYTIDPAHTSVEFVGRQLMITNVRGRFPDVAGTMNTEDKPEREVDFDGAGTSPVGDERICFSAQPRSTVKTGASPGTWSSKRAEGSSEWVRIELNIQAVAG